MKWDNIFTIPDDTLIKDGSVDPMGMQMIWTHFGQQIFQNKLTTVATDIRNYTINLIHHVVLNRFQLEKNESFTRALNHFSDYRNDYDLKAGLLIFLEDLLVYALISQESKIESLGILGSSKAKDNLAACGDNLRLIKIHAEKTKGALVRQIQLGVNGRYKGPFMNMDLLTKNFTYNQREFKAIEKRINEWPAATKLIESLIDILEDLTTNASKKHPVVTLDQYRQNQELWDLYVTCFGKEKVNIIFKEYWEDKLGLTKGAAKSIYEQIDIETEPKTSLLLAAALKEEADEEEQEKLKKILAVEPFLTICSQVFYLLANTGIKKIKDVEEDLKLLSKYLSLSNVQPLIYENNRLSMLYKHLKEVDGDPERLAYGVLAYHKEIMENRGGGAWVELENGQLKHYIAQFPSLTTDQIIKENIWYHDYYLWSMRSIYNGLNPN